MLEEPEGGAGRGAMGGCSSTRPGALLCLESTAAEPVFPVPPDEGPVMAPEGPIGQAAGIPDRSGHGGGCAEAPPCDGREAPEAALVSAAGELTPVA